MSDTYSRAGWPTDAERIVIRQNGQAELDAQDIAMQHAYHAWLATPEGQNAAQYARAYALHMAFDRGAEAARQAHEAEHVTATKNKAHMIPFTDLEGAEAEHAAMLDWLSIRGPIE